MRRPVIGAVLLLLLLGGGALGLAWRASDQAMHPQRADDGPRISEYPDLTFESTSFTSKTGVQIAGRFFSGQSQATIILSHGYGGSQDEMLPLARLLHDAGFAVFTYDLRGCGESGGAVTFGALEQQDLRSAVDYLSGRTDVDRNRIGAMGFSMGAATTLMSAADDPRIKGVVDDSGWADVYHWLRPSFRSMLLHPTAMFSPLSLKLVELRTGVGLSSLRPVDVIARISPRPLLIIHGTADTVVPPGDSAENFSAAQRPKQLWWMERGAHGESVRAETPHYGQRIVAFFREALHV